MENTLSSKVKWLRVLALVFCILPVVFFLFRVSFLSSFEDLTKGSVIYNRITNSFFIILYALLIALSSNKATKVSCIILVVNSIMSIINNWVQIPVVFNIIATYCFATILINNEWKKRQRTWIVLLVVLNAIDLIQGIEFLCISDMMMEYFDHFWWYTPIYGIWGFIAKVFSIVIYFNLIYSSAFNGVYDSSRIGNFNPMNKYMLGYIAAVAIGVAGVLTVYSICL